MTHFPKASIQDYGFKNRPYLAPLLKWVGIVFFVLMMFMLYLPIIKIGRASCRERV